MVFAKLGDGGLFIGLSFWIGVAVLIYLAKRKSFRFKEGQITERWETLINQGSGNTDAVYEVIYHFLESVNPPKVKWERAGVRAGDLLTGRQYDGLKVTNSYLKDYMMYIFAYDYGTSLHVAWFLTYQKPFFRFAKIMDIPQQLELNAYVTTAHEATKMAVQTVMQKLNQDFSKVNTKSRGFLEVW